MQVIVTFFDLLFAALQLAIILRALISWAPVDRYSPFVVFLDQITEPILAPLRRFIPPLGGTLDITPIVALIILWILQAIVHSMFRYAL